MRAILVAEDDPDLAAILQIVLTQLGYEAVMCRDGTELLARWRDGDLDDPALFVVDVTLPGELDGHDVVRSLRAQGVEVPILMMTGRASDADRAASLAAGATRHLTKPFDLERLVAIVESLATPASP